ncbi:MAG: UvrD-helicase domain-containing protein, partial [Clostridia bacterium]|nr:UvrD-helicase domain-containing protein [Clostridia bacterium]
MMSVQYTKEQQRVIVARNRNLLVSAAAGSGKTAVLVERLIQKIMDEQHPVNIDQMLVMTFTEAAASQMKERISKTIEEELRKKPESVHLQKQALLIHSAPISTIHRFCLNVLRNHFHEIDLDPGFRVADEGECKLLKAEIIQKVLEAAYQEGSEDFLHMTESYSAKKTDVIIENLVENLYNYAMSYPIPKKWLKLCADAYDVTGKESPEDFPWVNVIVNEVQEMLVEIKTSVSKAITFCTMSDGPFGYLEAVKSDLAYVDLLLGIESFKEYERAFSLLSFEKLGRNSSKSAIDPYKQEMVKTLREQYKKQLLQIRDQYFYDTPENLFDGMKESARAVNALVKLTEEFIDQYGEAKREKNIIDFNDMEHMALDILLEESGDELIPSKTAKEYQDYYEEVLIDEYQDSNLVQEYLVKSISKQDQKNIFMVGDVKQSIYRFRLARPELFMEKYHTYQTVKEVNTEANTEANAEANTEANTA